MSAKSEDKKEEKRPESKKRESKPSSTSIPRSTTILIVLMSAAIALLAISLFERKSDDSPASVEERKSPPDVGRQERKAEPSIPPKTTEKPPSEAPSQSKKDTGKRLFPVSANDKVFTVEELGEHGPNAKEIYLAIFGRVYDVTKGKKHYGKNGGYWFFAGKDATRSFVSGDFTDEGLTDDLTDLSPSLLLGIEEWVETYDKDYKYIGILAGRFYNSDRSVTQDLLDVEEKIKRGHVEKATENNLMKLFPSCNSHWSAGKGEVSCSKKSGGIERNWVGVPRKLFTAGGKRHRCACVKNFGPGSDGEDKGKKHGDLDDPRLKQYDGCPANANACKVGS
eukprot:m.309638 g.309638  ORF g.309638 m.309638 type:complete len:337 (+) comp47159_c0_seq1:81-1091(+)